MKAHEEHIVDIPISDQDILQGDLQIPAEAKGIVLFAHGSGSSRHSPRNRFVAHVLNTGSFGTLLIDLLTIKEERLDEQTRHLRFDIELLTERLCIVADWLLENKHTQQLSLGLFGASTGAAGALCAAAKIGMRVKAIVSRGGRPDLAGSQLLSQVISPTLFIVGGNDEAVITMNEEALQYLACEKKMVIVAHATHLFEEKGALEQVADLALKWFTAYLK